MPRALAAFLLAALAVALAPAGAATIAGSVIGEGARPIAGATVEVVGAPCATRTADDGTFSLTCAATGPHRLRASFGDLRPWIVEDIALGRGDEIHLNFMLLPASLPAPAPVAAPETGGFWSRPVPNPVVATWGDTPVTLRALAIVVAALALPLGAITMLALGRRVGIHTRRLSSDEVGDMVVNPTLPSVGERLTPIATVGAHGAEAAVSFGADEIAAALADGRYGLVFASLVIAPGLFALFGLGLALAMLIGQATWLLLAMLVVPAGFVLTPIVIGVQALRRPCADPRLRLGSGSNA